MNKQVNNTGLVVKYIGLLFCLLLSACTFQELAPVESRAGSAAGRSQDSNGTYRVRPGDTLFGIAFSYGLDQRSLAAWNNISEPYTIYPDQVLRLSGTSQGSSSSSEVKIYKASTPQSTTTRTYTTRDVPVTGGAQKPVPPASSDQASSNPAGSTQAAGTQSPVTQSPAAQTPPVSTQKPVPPATSPDPSSTASTAKPTATRTVPPPAPKPVTPQSNADPSSWRWPTTGRVLRGFVAGDPARNGLDIAGSEGQAIEASAAGTVAYSGNGLIGYGELIIVKHSDNMLSAYAHNKVRLVAEGQQVAAGEKIAEMGRNDRNEQLLHFEIRVLGKPVNPLTYLPSQ